MKTNHNENRMDQRKKEQLKQQKNMRRLIWITAIVVVAMIAVILITRPSSAPVDLPSADIPYETMPVLGDSNAPVKIVEVGDYKCPACQIFSQNIEPQIKKDYIDTGIVSFHFMNMPFIGPDSYTAALAGQSIFHQNNEEFWKYYDAIYRDERDEDEEWATPEFLTELAKQEGLSIDYDQLKKDIVSKAYEDEVGKHSQFARNNNVTHTPTLFINGKKFENVFDYEAIKSAIEDARNSK